MQSCCAWRPRQSRNRLFCPTATCQHLAVPSPPSLMGRPLQPPCPGLSPPAERRPVAPPQPSLPQPPGAIETGRAADLRPMQLQQPWLQPKPAGHMPATLHLRFHLPLPVCWAGPSLPRARGRGSTLGYVLVHDDVHRGMVHHVGGHCRPAGRRQAGC